MKPLLLLLGFAIFCAGCGKSTRDVELQEQLTAYFQALVQGRQQVAIEKMDPRFFPSPDVKKEAIRLLNESTASFVYQGITSQQPFGYFKGSNSVHCLRSLRTTAPGPASREWGPAKHLFGLNRASVKFDP
jgi:hypothetical protein